MSQLSQWEIVRYVLVSLYYIYVSATTLPHKWNNPCYGTKHTHKETWQVFDSFKTNYGKSYIRMDFPQDDEVHT